MVATFMMQQGGGFQDSRDAAEVPDPLAHFTGIGQQLVGIVVSAGDDSQHGCQRAGRGYPLLISDPPVGIEGSRAQHGGLLIGAGTERGVCLVVQCETEQHRLAEALGPLHGLGEQAITAALVPAAWAARPVTARFMIRIQG